MIKPSVPPFSHTSLSSHRLLFGYVRTLSVYCLSRDPGVVYTCILSFIFFLFIMVPSTSRVVVFLALLLPTIVSIAVPVTEAAPQKLDVPWKKSGLYSGYRRRRDGYNTGCNHGPETRGCWPNGFDIDTDMNKEWPDTGKTVKYDLTITNVTGAPDGFERQMFHINGQFPGPVSAKLRSRLAVANILQTIIADWGDDLEITVTNSVQSNGTGLHWHGMRQLGSNEQDGVNGITECPIPPGGTRVYKFKATQFGTTWYHSHYSVQYGDGIWGPMIIRGPSTADWDIDLGALPMTDWFHATTFTVNAAAVHANGPPTADNVLINGTMTSTAGGAYAETILTPGKAHLLRLMNVGINNYLHVGLDGHEFQVISADFTPIKPFFTNTLSIAVGQRYEVIINATQPIGNYWLRVGTGGACDGPNANAANIRSIFRYAGAKSGEEPKNDIEIDLPSGCYDQPGIIPHIKTTVPQNVPKQLSLGFNPNYTSSVSQSRGLVQWLVNGAPMAIDLQVPTLQSVLNGNVTTGTNRHVFEVDQKSQWQYWLIHQEPTAPRLPHPIHLHGHDFFVLAQVENAVWDGDISRLQMDNPVRRDTADLPAGGYLVLAFESDNPGAWLMHCHIPFHVAAGLGVQFVERRGEITAKDGFAEMKRGCGEWGEWVGEAHPNGILFPGDSGLR
ncbi:copper ion binding [Pyrenophora seminiperda CCB06]|uniref:Copper ion binding n=1 Tax=Pyrenophora seminiperda CCB06 TaxID=1302712 RepID=A0A3M7MFD0_9PLEO|nr:copper ion binding [Pyrenophora seminiperda CCB06]